LDIFIEDKMLRFKGECAQFSFNQCPVYTYTTVQVPNLALSHTKKDNSAERKKVDSKGPVKTTAKSVRASFNIFF
jgi:hypothetical protein